MRYWVGGVLIYLVAGNVQAEGTEVETNGFVSVHKLSMQASPARVYEALTSDIGRWSDSAHTFSGDAANLSIDGAGCFCEHLPDGRQVVHMRVVYAALGNLLRLNSGLGPLRTMAGSGAMEFALNDEGDGTTSLTHRYTVGRYTPGGLPNLAPIGDADQLGKLQRLQAYLAL